MPTFPRTLIALAGVLAVALAAACTSDNPAAPAATTVPSAVMPPESHSAPGGAVVTPLSTTLSTPAPSSARQTQPSSAVTAPLSTVQLVKLLRPSVVHVQTEMAAGVDFPGRAVPQTGVGTGSIIDAQGHIVTNSHVVEGARRITVALEDGRAFTARLVGADPFTDLAVIKIDAQGLTPAELGDSDALEVGEDVVAIGFALDLEGGPTVTKGVVSALDRTVGDLDGLIQTDTDINPGNSGGPLVNLRGEVVGVNTLAIRESALSTGGPDAQGINFAISISQAKDIINSLIEGGRVVRSFLGVRLSSVTPAIARNNNLPVERGVIIVRVDANTPAGRAGIQANDIVVAMEGQTINSTGRLLRLLTKNPPGTKVKVELFRGSTKRTVEVTLGERPGS